MPSNSELVCWLCFCCGLFFSCLSTLGEPIGCVSGFDDRAVMRDAIQKRGRHLGISEDRYPFPKLQIRCDGDAGFLI